jgi:predicted nucleotidyltransferase
MEDSEEQFRQALPEGYRRAFDAAFQFIQVQFNPDGIVVSGTIARGNPDPASDLDVVVVHHQPWRT